MFYNLMAEQQRLDVLDEFLLLPSKSGAGPVTDSDVMTGSGASPPSVGVLHADGPQVCSGNDFARGNSANVIKSGNILLQPLTLDGSGTILDGQLVCYPNSGLQAPTSRPHSQAIPSFLPVSKIGVDKFGPTSSWSFLFKNRLRNAGSFSPKQYIDFSDRLVPPKEIIDAGIAF